MAYLITGGTGFIGAYVARDLVRMGERVVCFDIAPNTKLLADLTSPEDLAKVTVVRGDVADLPQLLRALREHSVHTIIHMASPLSVSANANFPFAMKVMCEGTNNVFEAAALLGLRKVVWAGSMGVFGPRSDGPGGVVANDSLFDPPDAYAACKVYNEQMALHYAGRYDMDIIGLRFTLTYGHGRAGAPGSGSGATYMYELIDKPALGLGPCVVPHGDTVMSWLAIEDAARAVQHACRTSKPRTKTFTIHGFPHALREVAEHVRQLLPDTQFTVESGTRERGRPFLDGGPARDELGFAAEIDIAEGVKSAINTIREHAGLPAVD